MKLYKQITVDLYNPYPLPKMTAQQNNIGRGALVTLTAEGTVIDPLDETVTAWARKKDGTVSYIGCEYDGGKIKIDFTNQMLAIPGELQVEIRMTGAECDISTPIFIVDVGKTNIDNDAIESQDEFPVFQQVLNEVNQLSKEIADETKNRNNADDVLNARINALSTLKEGSTTGDAELQDIRVGADGKIYASAGEAVRGQVGELNNDLSKYDKDYEPLYSGTVSGLLKTNIKLIGGNTYIVKNNGTSPVGIQNRNASGEIIDEGVSIQANSESIFVPTQNGFIALLSNEATDVVVENANNIYYKLEYGIEKVKQDLTKYTGIKTVDTTNGYYIQTNAPTVDIDEKVPDKLSCFAVVDCVEGERFTISGVGRTVARLWCFIDENGNVLKRSYNSENGYNSVILTPKNATKLVCNFSLSYPHIMYYGALDIDNEIQNIRKSNDHILLSDCTHISAYIDINGKYGYVEDKNTDTLIVPVKQSDVLNVRIKDGMGVYLAFLKSYPFNLINGVNAPLSVRDGYGVVYYLTKDNDFEYIIPDDVCYVAVSNFVQNLDRAPSVLAVNNYDIINDKWLHKKFRRANKLICTIIDDDAQNVESLQNLYTECEKNGIKCTMASLTDKWENNDALLNQLYMMEEQGYHVVLHAYSQDGNYNWLDIESRVGEYTQNFVKGLRMMHKAGFANCDFWVTPAGIQTPSAQAIARKYGMKALIAGGHALNISDRNNFIKGYIEGQTTIDGRLDYRENSRWNIMRATLFPADTDEWTLQDLKDLALRGTEHNSWLILVNHSYQWTDTDDHRNRFGDFVSYAKSIGYEFMTLGEAWSYKSIIYDDIDRN